MMRAYKVFLATAYPQREIVGTMKRLLACLALCASLSASAQDDNCTVLGVQELSSLYSELSQSIDTIVSGLAALQPTSTLHSAQEIQQVHPFLNYFECQAMCYSTGEGWEILDLESVGLHMDSVLHWTSSNLTGFQGWLRFEDYLPSSYNLPYLYQSNGILYYGLSASGSQRGCFCTKAN